MLSHLLIWLVHDRIDNIKAVMNSKVNTQMQQKELYLCKTIVYKDQCSVVQCSVGKQGGVRYQVQSKEADIDAQAKEEAFEEKNKEELIKETA